jgi:hypothetical protein
MCNFSLGLGWIIGSNVRIDTRWATANASEIRRQAAELAALAPDVILAHGSSTVGWLLEATRAGLSGKYVEWGNQHGGIGAYIRGYIAGVDFLRDARNKAHACAFRLYFCPAVQGYRRLHLSIAAAASRRGEIVVTGCQASPPAGGGGADAVGTASFVGSGRPCG